MSSAAAVVSICVKCERVGGCPCGDVTVPLTPTTSARYPAAWGEWRFKERLGEIQMLRPWLLPSASCISDGPVAGSFKRPAVRAVVPVRLDVSWSQGAYPLARRSLPPDVELRPGWAQMRGRGLVAVRNTEPLHRYDHDRLHDAIRATSERISAGLRATLGGEATVFWASKDLLSAYWRDAPGEHPILVVKNGRQLAWVPGRSQQPFEPARLLSSDAPTPWTGEGNTWFKEGRLYPIDRAALRPQLLDVAWEVQAPLDLARELAGWKVLA